MTGDQFISGVKLFRDTGDRAFSAATPRLWNSLPTDLVTSQSLATF